MSKPNLSQATTIIDEELESDMAYHAWDDAKVAKGKVVRDALSQALRAIIENVPPSADRSAAIRKLRDARMDANSAITHDGAF